MPVKAKKLKKVRIRKVRQVRARRQPATKKPPITNVNIHFAGGSQHAGSVYIPNAGEHQVIPMSSVQPTQAFVPSSLAKPVSQEIHTPTPKVGVSSVGTQHEEPEIHTFYEETHTPMRINPMLSRLVSPNHASSVQSVRTPTTQRINPLLSSLVSPVLGSLVSPVMTPVTTSGGATPVEEEVKNFIDINRGAVREASRVNTEKRRYALTPVRYESLSYLQDVALNDYGISKQDTNGKIRTRIQLQLMIKNARK